MAEGFANQQRTYPTLRFDFPGSQKRTILQSAPPVWQSGNGKLEWNGLPPVDLGLDRYYMPFWMFVNQLRERSGFAIKLEGWRNPKITIGSTTLQIGSEQTPAQPWQIYSSIVGRTLMDSFYPKINSWGYHDNSAPHAIRTGVPIGAVYAVVTPSVNQTQLHIDVARVADDGVLYFDAPYKVLEFVRTPLEVVKDRVNINKKGYGSSSRPAKALLIRISSDLKTTFELPARVRSGALK
jgi:hypothetical protein